MKNRLKYILLLILVSLMVTSCKEKNEYEKYNKSVFNTFDTIIEFTAYTKKEEEFNEYFKIVNDEFNRLHKLYDQYNDYDGVNNIKTINDAAGKEAIKVDKDLINMLKFSKDMAEKYSMETNIALGPVLEIWHDYREEGMEDEKSAKVPEISILEEASKNTDINKVIIDDKNNTVFLEDENMSLDTGATSKGYASQLVMDKIEKEGCNSAILSAGGNIISLGKPMELDKEKWGIGIQSPNTEKGDTGSSIVEVIYGNDISLVTSGDYQRYYEVDGKRYSHIIDSKTLMPADNFKSVTVLAEDSGVADFFSTTLFILPLEEGQKLLEEVDGVEAIWIDKNDEKTTTRGMDSYLKSSGAKNK